MGLIDSLEAGQFPWPVNRNIILMPFNAYHSMPLVSPNSVSFSMPRAYNADRGGTSANGIMDSGANDKSPKETVGEEAAVPYPVPPFTVLPAGCMEAIGKILCSRMYDQG